MLHDEAIGERLDALGPWLATWRPAWSVRPFKVHRPAWVDEHPALARWLERLSPEAVAALEDDPLCLDGPAPWPELVAQARALADIGPLPRGEALPPTHPLARRVPGRKWTQVDAFRAAVEPSLGEGPVVEWCAGRGHLGRTLAARLGRPALLVEKEPELCGPPDGRPELPGVRHVRADVLEPQVADAIPADTSVVGLHACGRLTERLVDVALARGAAAVAAAPCCPHRRFGMPLRPARSVRATAHDLVLDEEELRLAVLDDVVVRPRRRRLRERELLLRTAVDLLAREATGEDRYHGFPSVDRLRFDEPLADFVPWAAATFGLPLPARWDPDAVERAAAERVRRVRAYGALRLVFRRPLEVWLVLDQAWHLVEQGWSVRVGTFCPREATPRNLLIVGTPGRG